MSMLKPDKPNCKRRNTAGFVKNLSVMISEISRKEKYQLGTMPLSTIRENIDYVSVPALTKSGYVEVKVWISKK